MSGFNTYINWSLSARRAWIEITHQKNPSKLAKVALRKESVDRNAENPMICVDKIVALRKESVDRNRKYLFLEAVSMVALRKESVDRN